MEYSGNDFYCDVALKDTEVLRKEYESAEIVAFHHTKPHWPVHIVVIPKRHIASFTTIGEEDAEVAAELFTVVQSMARKVEETHGAARILTNLGAYQDSKHLHIHVISGEQLV